MRNKKKAKLLEEKIKQLQEDIQEKSEDLKEKSEESVHLQQQLNFSFEAIVELAKKNDPLFYVRFREVYPNIHEKLLAINPDLRISQLTLCAYIYLDFPAKEIAEYTFKSVKTIQNRKNGLRKMLNIASDVDLNVWLKSL